MFEQLLILTRGGLILWSFKEPGDALEGSPVNTLITSCLLEERSGDSSYNYDAPGAQYTQKWTFHNELGLIFVAVYYKFLGLLYVDDLLAKVKQEFSEIYDPKRTVYNDFDDVFRQLWKEAKARAEELKISKQEVKPSNVSSKKQGQTKITRLDGNGKQKSKSKYKAKRNRVWNESPSEFKLDFSDPVDELGIVENMELVAANHGESSMVNEVVFSSEEDEKGWCSSMFQSIAGKANLEKLDLELVRKSLKDRLLTKNVAEEIAEKLCESVAASLEGKELASFTRVSSTVQAAMEAALVRI